MPVGKNSLKRVTNSGYSKVKTEAPDMENSTVEALPKEEARTESAKKPAAKKTASQQKKEVQNPGIL